MPPRIGLVTVTYNSAGVLEPFLACVKKQTLADHLLVVVDNASSDASLELLRQFTDPRMRVIANDGNLGVATGNNQGIRACLDAGIDWVLLINNDTEFGPELCEMLLQAAIDGGQKVVVPVMTYFDAQQDYWYTGGDFIWYKGAIQTRHSERPGSERTLRRVDYAPTCCMLVHRSVFEQVGLMDDAYFVYWDDTDFCWRLKRHGVPIMLDTGARLAHKVSRLTGGPQSPFSIRYYSRNQVYFLRKHFPAVVVATCVMAVRLKNTMRRVLGLDDAEAAKLRRAAILEGKRMPLG